MVHYKKFLGIIGLFLDVTTHESLTSAYFNLDLVSLLSLNFSSSNKYFGTSICSSVGLLTIIKVFMSLVITPIVVIIVRINAPVKVLFLLILYGC